LQALGYTGYTITIQEIRPVDDLEGGISRSLELIRWIAVTVDDAVDS